MSVTELNVRLLLAVAVIALCVQAVGWLMERIGQPRVIGEITAGILLGPSLLGLVAPQIAAHLFPGPVVDGVRIVSQLGLVLFMFLVGLHLDLASLRTGSRTVGVVTQIAVLVPLGLGAGLALVVHPTFGEGVPLLPFAIFIGAAMSVTALPVLARLLTDLGLSGSRIGQLALACAAITDVLAWCLVAVVGALLGSGVGGPLWTVGLALSYLVGMFLVVRPLLARLQEVPVWAVLVVAIASAWVAEQIGIHAIIGAFLAGVVMPNRPRWRQDLGQRMDTVVRYLLLPLFFVTAGLATRVDQLTGPAFLLLAAVVVVAVVGKLGAGTLAARMCGERWSDALGLGALLNTRGVTELVILSVGLQLGIISTTVYTVMVLMALITTMATTPLLVAIRGRRSSGRPDTADTVSGSPADGSVSAGRGPGPEPRRSA